MMNVMNLELRRNIKKGSILSLAAFVLLAVIILQIGVNKYKIGIEQQEQFLEIEQKTAKKLLNYMQYGTIGFRVILDPSALISLFYNNTAFSDLVGIIDSGVRLRLNEPKIGPNTFKNPTGGSLDLSWYLIIFGSLFILAWGFFTFRNKGYIRFLMNFAGPKSVYLGILLGRVILLTIVLAILIAVVSIQFLVNGIDLTGIELFGLLVFMSLALLVMVFLLVIAAGLGAVENWVKGGVVTAFFWLVVVLLWPEMLNLAFSYKSVGVIKSTYKLESEKMDKLMNFEREALKESDRYNTKEEKLESDKRMAEHYWNNIYEGIEQLDIRTINHITLLAKRFHLLSLFSPVTFFKSVNNEISSLGFNGFLELYKGNREKKRGFLRYVFDKRFYKNYSTVSPYLPKGKAIIAAKSGLPNYFGIGMITNLFYILLALFFAYLRFIKYIFPTVSKESTIDTSLFFNRGELAHVCFNEPYLKDPFINVFLGQSTGIPGKITLDGKEQTPLDIKKASIFYLPTITKFPSNIRAKSLLSLAQNDGPLPQLNFDLDQPFGKLSTLEKINLFFIQPKLRKSDIIIMDDIADGVVMSVELFEQVGKLKEESGALIIDFSAQRVFTGNADSAYIIIKEPGSNRIESRQTHYPTG